MQNISLYEKTILITGAAGFIGCFLTKKLLELDETVRIIVVRIATTIQQTPNKTENGVVHKIYDTGNIISTPLETGLARFAAWYKSFYGKRGQK